MARPRFYKLPPEQQQAILRAALDEFATHGFNAASLNRIIDASGISFLREDAQDAAQIQTTKASTIKTLIDAGYRSDSVIAAVVADDFTLLEHTGLFSVQLQPAGTVSEGKGSVFQGVPTPDKGNGSNSQKTGRWVFHPAEPVNGNGDGALAALLPASSED